jgi:vacuolar-type H+-ATPase subunit B/Vma2
LKAGDNNDYYSLNLAEGEPISLQLTIPGNANFGITLLNPHSYSRGSSTIQGDIKTLDYVADSTGTWYIKVYRSSGEGEYELAVDINMSTEVDETEEEITSKGREAEETLADGGNKTSYC